MHKFFALGGPTIRTFVLLTLLAMPFSGAAGGPFINGSFIKGANLPWLDGAFGHDIGTTPVEPDYTCAYSSADMNLALSNMHLMGITVVRLWLNEEEQGLVLDNNGNVTGLQALFLANLDNIVALAATNGISMYLTLANSYDSDGSDGSALVTDSALQGSYITNAIIPIVTRYKGNTNIFGFDVMNEIDSLSPFGYGLATWAQIQTYVAHTVAAIHGADSSRLASCSLGFGPAWPRLSELKGLGMDFYDFHDYEDVPQDAASFYAGVCGDDIQSFPTAAGLALDKPILIGECGQSTMTQNEAIQNTCILDYLDLAKTNGFAGILVWAYGVTSDPDYLSMLNPDGSWRTVCYSIQSWTYNNPPVISSFNPTSDPAGVVIFNGSQIRVMIYGTNFTGATSVAFNGVATTNFIVYADTVLSVAVPANATSGPLSVTTPAGTGQSAGDFTVETVAPESLTIYMGVFTNDFDTGGGAVSTATVNVSNTSPVYSGHYSVSVTFNTATSSDSFYFWHEPEFSTLPYGSLDFWINGGPTGVQGLELIGSEELFQVGEYALPTLAPNTWTHFNIPLSEIGVADMLDCDGFSFLATSGAGTFYLDSIQLDMAGGLLQLSPVSTASESGLFVFQVSGVAGQTNLIETSTNLINWTITSTNVLTAASANITNSVISNSRKQFWRVVQPQ